MVSSHLHPTVHRPVQTGRTGPGSFVLVGVVAVLTWAAAIAGLIDGELYLGARSTATMLRGYDLVTAVLVVPALIITMIFVHRGSVLGRLVAAGLLADLVYIYAFYVFGTGFNDLFLLHIAVFATGLVGLVLMISGVDVAAVAERFGPRAHARPAAAALGVLSVSLAAMWTWAAVDQAVTGTVPVGSGLVETALIIHVGLALDLAVQVPLYGAAAVLLWRRRGWGYVLAVIALVSGIPEQISYLVAMPFQAVDGVPGAVWTDPLEPVILAFYVFGLLMLLLGSKTPRAPSAP